MGVNGTNTDSYADFLARKTVAKAMGGFKPVWVPDFLFDFQRHLVDWSVRQGRCAILADCGLGKTPMQLVWAENIVRKTGKNVLILAPLAVSPQTVLEGEKFGVKVHRSRNGETGKGITITNYQQLHKFNPKDFIGLVLDESSILKNFDGNYKKTITEFMLKVEYRLLCTATPAPNDYMELGTSSEALGVMGRNSMLGMFFTNDMETTQQWRLKRHAAKRFWQWVATWARAVRKPSDLGYPDKGFILPKLNVIPHMVKSGHRGGLLAYSASTLDEQRKEKRKTVQSRCEKVADCIPQGRPCVVWCQLNDESSLLAELIPDAVEVRGSDDDETKEKNLSGFSRGDFRVMVTKPSIASFGLNWQHCADICYFPTWSHEAYYQAIRRCWRFGQKKEVTCNLVYSEGERFVVSGMLKKEKASIEMYDSICKEMGAFLTEKKEKIVAKEMEVASWLK